MSVVYLTRVLSLALAFLPGLSKPCGVGDARSGFGECDEESNTRQAFFYFDAGCESNGSLALPPPATLGCDIHCNPGTFLTMNISAPPPGSPNLTYTPTCSACSAGSYSLGGGFAITGENREWLRNRWITAMESFCIGQRGAHWYLNGNGCQAWQPGLNGTVINSGNNTGKHNLISILKLVVVAKKTGYVKFRYRVEAQHGRDGLEFTVNHIIRLHYTSNQPTWRELQFQLPVGSHVLEWFFKKDASGDYGRDIAELELIEVAGTEFQDLACAACPAGTESVPGSSACARCKDNEYATSAHYGQCIACPSGTYSFKGAVGAASCKPRLPCTPEDYTKNFTACDVASQKRNMYYNWTLPHICDPSAGVSLPPGVSRVDCEPCQPGMAETNAGVCQACPPGHFLPTDAPPHAWSCRQCPLGQQAVEEVYYEFWYQWPEGFQNGGGWGLHEDYSIAGGLGQHPSDSASLTLDRFFRQDGFINFTYEAIEVTVTDEPDIDTFGFFVDGAPAEYLLVTKGLYNVSVPVSAGQHHFLWNVRGNNIMRLHRVIVVGVDGGGSTYCTPCPLGFESSQDRSECVACPPGHATVAGVCRLCPHNTYTERGHRCNPCGAGTHSAPGSTRCEADGVFAGGARTGSGDTPAEPRQYNVSALTAAFRREGEAYMRNDTGAGAAAGLPGVVFASGRSFLFSLGAPTQVGTQSAYLIENVKTNAASAGSTVPATGQYGESLTCNIAATYARVTVGSEMAVREMTQPSNGARNPARGGGLVLNLTRGAPCANSSREWGAVLSVACDLTITDMYASAASPNVMDPATTADNASCVPIVITMASRDACPVCEEADWVQTRGECKHGKQHVTWSRLIACVGGVQKSDYDQTCDARFSKTVIVLMSLSIAAGFVIIVALGYYFYRLRRRFKDVHNKYVILRDGYDKNSFNLVPSGAQDLGAFDDDVDAKSAEPEMELRDEVDDKTLGDVDAAGGAPEVPRPAV